MYPSQICKEKRNKFMSIDKLMSDDNYNIDKGLYLYVEMDVQKEGICMCQFYINVNKQCK